MKQNTAYISIGSNIGVGIENCRKAVAFITGDAEIVLTGHSRFFMTEPVGYTNQPWFVNAVIRIVTGLEPMALLKRLKQAERDCGRIETGIRFGPRVIDFDIILYNDVIMETPELTIPHPRMHLRRFVLFPLCDIAPELRHPSFDIPMRQLLDRLPGDGQQCRPVEEAVETKPKLT